MNILGKSIKYKIFEWCIDTMFDKIITKFNNVALSGTILTVYDIRPGMRISTIVAEDVIYYDCVIKKVNIKEEDPLHGSLYFSCSSYDEPNQAGLGIKSKDGEIMRYPVIFAIEGKWQFIL